jgi:HAD superfamily hydrolase (TIGR01509 family)
MMIPANIEAVIFDMDGVLLISQPVHQVAYQETFESVGIAQYDYPSIAGRRTDEAITVVLTANGIEPEAQRVAALVEIKRDKAHQRLRAQPPLADRCAATLQELARQRKLALASSAGPANIELFLEASGTRNLFTAVLQGDDVAAAKPAPDIYLTTLQRLGVQADQAIVIEDAISGIQAARSAGIEVIAVSGTCSRDELARQDVCAVIDTIGELVDGSASHS